MRDDVDESDWKWFRQVRGVALQRFCDSVLEETGAIMADTARSSHERFIAVYNLIQERNGELADGFDSPKRSAMLVQLAFLRGHKLLTDDEFFLFRRETCETVTALLGGESGDDTVED